MTAISLLDVLMREASGAGSADARSMKQVARLAAKLVESALSDWERVLELEQQFGSADFSSISLDHEINRSLYQIYEQWALEAQEVLKRVTNLEPDGQPVEKLESLANAYSRALARLKLTPNDLARAMEQVRNGQAVALKELRDELRSRVRA